MLVVIRVFLCVRNRDNMKKLKDYEVDLFRVNTVAQWKVYLKKEVDIHEYQVYLVDNSTLMLEDENANNF